MGGGDGSGASPMGSAMLGKGSEGTDTDLGNRSGGLHTATDAGGRRSQCFWVPSLLAYCNPEFKLEVFTKT